MAMAGFSNYSGGCTTCTIQCGTITTFNSPTFLRESKNMNTAGCLKLKFTFYFMESTHDWLHSVKLSFELERSWTDLHVLLETLFSLTELLNMAVFRNYEVMLGQTLNYFM
jgi:hypothetical protein